MLDLNRESSALEGSRQTKKACITLHRPEQFRPFPVALICPAPSRVQHAPLIMPRQVPRTPVHKTQASALYMGKILTPKDHFHSAIVSLSFELEKREKQ